jgi:hypothetical protein
MPRRPAGLYGFAMTCDRPKVDPLGSEVKREEVAHRREPLVFEQVR